MHSWFSNVAAAKNLFLNKESRAVSKEGLNSVGQGWDTGFWLSNKPPS